MFDPSKVRGVNPWRKKQRARGLRGAPKSSRAGHAGSVKGQHAVDAGSVKARTMSIYSKSPVRGVGSRHGRATSLFHSAIKRTHAVDRAPRRDLSISAFRRADALERGRRRDTLELLLRETKGFSIVAHRLKLQSGPALDRCAGRLQRLLRSLDAAEASRDRENARKAIDAYMLEARRLLGYAREEFDRGGKPTQIMKRITELENRKRSAWRPATSKGGGNGRPLFTAEFPRNAIPTDFFATRHDPGRSKTPPKPLKTDSEQLAGNTRNYQDLFDLAGGAYGTA